MYITCTALNAKRVPLRITAEPLERNAFIKMSEMASSSYFGCAFSLENSTEANRTTFIPKIENNIWQLPGLTSVQVHISIADIIEPARATFSAE